MKILSATYAGNADSFEACPPNNKPEFAFIGRSNVGKSSLINSLTNHVGLAKVSHTPGKTRLINFFDINERFHLIDLPGYGYSKAGRKLDEAFNQAAADYLSQRQELKGIFVLVDCRRDPQDIDLQFLNWIQQFNRELVLVFTKSDLSSKEQVKANVKAFKAAMIEHGMPVPRSINCSAKSGSGKSAVFDQIQRMLPKTDKVAVKKKKASTAWLKNVGM